MEKFLTKSNAAEAGKNAGGIAIGVIGAHLATSMIPRFENKILDHSIPFALSGGSFIAGMAVKNKVAKIALLAICAGSFLNGTRRVIETLATPNAEGKVIIPESAMSFVDKILPLGCANVDYSASMGTVDLEESEYEMIEDSNDMLDQQLPIAGVVLEAA